MKVFHKIFYILLISNQVLGTFDLETNIDDFILETKRIEIPDYPLIFNPSIVRWKNKLLMSFRIRQKNTTNKIGLVWLNENLLPVSKAYILNINYNKPLSFYKKQVGGPYEQDPRLITMNNDLYVVYSHYQVGKMFIAKVEFDNNTFFTKDNTCIRHFDHSLLRRREKNWPPFEYKNQLMLSYTISPHRVYQFVNEKESCETIALTNDKIKWIWGNLRGGTPALIVDGNYLSFFHSSKEIATLQSEGKKIKHYFMGAYVFSSNFPFNITHVSQKPIIAKGLYNKTKYKLFKPMKVVFPCGFLFDEKYIWVFYGKDDNEAWYMKLDKQGLFKSLIPVNTN